MNSKGIEIEMAVFEIEIAVFEAEVVGRELCMN
jgi:hypothetical protein